MLAIRICGQNVTVTKERIIRIAIMHTIEMPKDKLADLIDFIRESRNPPQDLYEASVRWELEAFGVESVESADA